MRGLRVKRIPRNFNYYFSMRCVILENIIPFPYVIYDAVMFCLFSVISFLFLFLSFGAKELIFFPVLKTTFSPLSEFNRFAGICIWMLTNYCFSRDLDCAITAHFLQCHASNAQIILLFLYHKRNNNTKHNLYIERIVDKGKTCRRILWQIQIWCYLYKKISKHKRDKRNFSVGRDVS